MINDTESAELSQKQDERNIHAIMKTMCPPFYHHSGFVATLALGHMIYGYTLLVPMNQNVLNKRSNERNISGHKWSTTHSAQVLQKKDELNIHAIMKTMFPPGYHHSGFVATDASESLASVRFERSVCRESLMTTYITSKSYNLELIWKESPKICFHLNFGRTVFCSTC